MNIRNTLAVSLLALVAGVSLQASAAETTSSFSTTSSVISSCSIVSVGDISIGSYDAVGANEVVGASGISSLQIRCTAGSTASFGVNAGLHNENNSECVYPSRQMANGKGDFLGYQFMATLPNGGAVFNCNEPGVQDHTPLVFDTLETKEIYMRADAYGGQAAPVGDYSDTLTIKVTF